MPRFTHYGPPGKVTFFPDSELQVLAKAPASALVAYPSSIPGAFTLYMPGTDGNRPGAGIRLGKDQALALADELTRWAARVE